MPKTKKMAVSPQDKTNHSSAIVLTLILSIALGAAAYAQTATTTDNSLRPGPIHTQPVITPPIKEARPIDAICVVTAIDTRDSAVKASIITYQTAGLAAFQTRTDSLKAAWAGDRTKLRAATRLANNTYNKSLNDARKTLRASKQAANKQFAIDVKKCAPKGGVSTSDTGSIPLNSDL
ncbi:MAG: hypothetical protein V1846_05635 [Candidatus Komeilibacteria bacterium]